MLRAARSAAPNLAEPLERRVLLSGTATFVRADGSTAGDWLTAGPGGGRAYGTEGYALVDGPSAVPSYVSNLTFPGATQFLWSDQVSPAETRALAVPGAGADGARLAACWYGDSAFDVDLDFADGQSHQVAFYLLDFDQWGARAADVSVRDGDTGAPLDAARSQTQFFWGRYLVYTLSGHVDVHFAHTPGAGANAVLSGVFFDPTNAPAPSTVPYAPVGTMAGSTTTIQGEPYTLGLSATSYNGSGAIDHWSVDWGDGSDPDADGALGQLLAGNPALVTHTYAAASPAGGWRVSGTVTDAAGATAPVALALDGTFAAGGASPGTALGPAGTYGWGRVVATDPGTGRVAVGGHASPSVQMYGADGAPDASFTNPYLLTIVDALAFDGQGRLVTAGLLGDNFEVRRFLADGSPDPSFGTGTGADTGVIRADFGGYDLAYAVAVGPDGSVTVAGGVNGGPSNGDCNFALIRYTPAGLPDPNFGTTGDGKVNVDLGAWDSVRDVSLLPSGKLLAAGYANSQWVVARFRADGSLDPTFGGGDGVTYLDPTWGNDFAHGVDVDTEVLNSGKILLAGDAGWKVALARLNADGSPDGTFGGGGVRVTPWWTGYEQPTRLRTDAAGRPVLSFNRYDRNPAAGGPSHLAAARLNPNGTPDPTFGAAGVVDLPWRGVDQHGITWPGLALGAGGTAYVSGTKGEGASITASRLLGGNTVVVAAGPDAPAYLTAIPYSDTRIDLAWQPVSAATGYEVQAGPDGQAWTTVSVVNDPAATGYTDAGLAPATHRFYRVRTLQGSASGDWANADATTFATPSVPSGLVVVGVSASEISVAWDLHPQGEVLDGYELQRSSDGLTWATIAMTTDPADPHWIDVGLFPATTYAYRIRAVVGGATSDWSEVAQAATEDPGAGDPVPDNAPPTLAEPAAANPAEVTDGTTTQLSVLGADDGGEQNLSYSWVAFAAPQGGGGASFWSNGTNGGSNTTATFYKAGNYTLLVTIADAGGLSVTSTVDVTVRPTLSRITLNHSHAAVAYGESKQFTPTAYDQFGDPMAAQAGGYEWSVTDGPGQVSADGTYTAPALGAQDATVGGVGVQAKSGNVTATATLLIGQIVGSVYADQDGSGAADHNESGLHPWTVYLDDNDNGQLDGSELTAETDLYGDFALDLDPLGASQPGTGNTTNAVASTGTGTGTGTTTGTSTGTGTGTATGTGTDPGTGTSTGTGTGTGTDPGTDPGTGSSSGSSSSSSSSSSSGTSHTLRAVDKAGWQLTAPQGGSYTVQDDQVSSGNDFGEKPPVELVAYRTGGKFGEVVSEDVKNSYDASKYLILTNNDFEENNPDGTADNENDTAVTDGTDDDLVKITLKQLPSLPDGGSYSISLNDPGAVRLFKADGTLLYDGNNPDPSALGLDLAAPSGYLAGVTSGDLTIWLEGLRASPRFQLIAYYMPFYDWHKATGDAVDIDIAEMKYVDLTGNAVEAMEPVPMQQLLDLANGVSPTPPIPSGAYFRTAIDGLNPRAVDQLTVTSSTVPSDSFVDQNGGGPWFLSKYPTVIYTAEPDQALTDEQRELILTQLHVNAVHNQEAPDVRVQTIQDVQNGKAPAPGWNKILDEQTPFDLILVLSKDYEDYKTRLDSYVRDRKSKWSIAKSPQEVAALVTDRYNEVNKNAQQPRKLRVLFVGHGNEDEGPLVGSTKAGDYPRADLFDLSKNIGEYTDDEIAQWRANNLPTAKISGIKDKVQELTFSACQFAQNAKAQKFVDIFREDLHIAKVVVGKKELAPVWYQKGGTGPWVTAVIARENDEKTPVKGTTPDADVLYVSEAR